MFSSVKLLDPCQDPAIDKAFQVAVDTGKTATVEFPFQPFPCFFGRQMALAILKKSDYRFPARGQLKPSFP
jgi:hypothetical protein